jgi:hypothetical protein
VDENGVAALFGSLTELDKTFGLIYPLYFFSRGKSLKIKMWAPLDRIMGQLKNVTVQDPLAVADLLHLLASESPDFLPYAGFGPKDVQPYALLVWRGGKLLTLTDIVNPTDELEMIPMVAGG